MIAVADGEEARAVPGVPDAAEIVSRGRLRLRTRVPEATRLRPAHPGTAVVIGEATWEVVGSREMGEGVVYRLRPWPEGEAVRDRVVYYGALVRAGQQEREHARAHDRARPYRAVLYPLVGLLPAGEQVRACERLGLYTNTPTAVSGLLEALAFFVAIAAVSRTAGTGLRILLVSLSPVLGLAAVAGLARTWRALALREACGQWLVSLLWPLLSSPSRR